MPEFTDTDFMESGRFVSVDAKLAAGIAKVAQGGLGRTINSAKNELSLPGIFMKGRQALKTMYNRYRISMTEEAFWSCKTFWPSLSRGITSGLTSITGSTLLRE